jgi:hypothetical protein
MSNDLYKEYVEESLEEDNYYSEAVVKKGYYLRDNLILPYIRPTLVKQENQNKITSYVGNFIEFHWKELSTSGPVHIFTFDKKEQQTVYSFFEIEEEKVLELIQNMYLKTYEWSIVPKLFKDVPFRLFVPCIISESLVKNYSSVINACEYMLGFAEYPLRYRKQWKTGVQEEIMNYTIEHLQNKFKVKKMANLMELLKYDVSSAMDSHRDALLSMEDKAFPDYFGRIRNNFRSTFVNIAREYFKNWGAKHTQHQQSGTRDDGSLNDTEGQVSNTASIIDNTYSKLVVSPIYNPYVDIMSEQSSVDKERFLSYLNQIFTHKENKLHQFIEGIVISYFQKFPTAQTLKSEDFLNFGLALFKSVSASKNEIYQQISSILNFWMNDIINIRDYSNNEGTINNYRRAIYNYLLLMMIYHN